jgi:integrase/recombinase XerC
MRGPAAGPLFQTCRGAAGKPTGGRLSERHINRILAPYGVRPHGLRHSAITLALELTGGDITKVAKFSRHKNVATVLIYDDHRQDMGGQVADLLAASQPATVPDAPAVTAADLAVLTNTQRARVALLLAGCTVAAVAAGEGVGKASVVESVEQAEVKIPSLHAALEMAGVRRPRKAV